MNAFGRMEQIRRETEEISSRVQPAHHAESEFFKGTLDAGQALPIHAPLYPVGSIVKSRGSGDRYRVTMHTPSSVKYPGDWTLFAEDVDGGRGTVGWEGHFEKAQTV